MDTINQAGFVTSLSGRALSHYLNKADSLLVQAGIYFVRNPTTLSGPTHSSFNIPKNEEIDALDPKILKAYIDACVEAILSSARERIIQAYTEYAIFDSEWMMHAKSTTVYNIAFHDDINYRKKIFRKVLYEMLVSNAMDQRDNQNFIFEGKELYLVPCDIHIAYHSIYDKPNKFDYGFLYNLTLVNNPDDIPSDWYGRYTSFVKQYAPEAS